MEVNRKAGILNALRLIDESNSGFAKANIFFNLLACMGLALNDEDENQIRKNHSNANGKLINFEKVIPLLLFDLTKDEWVYQADTTGNNGSLERSDL